MHATNDLVHTYLHSWNETDPLRRRALVEQVWTEHARYTDPMVQVQGWQGIEATIAAVQGMFPDYRFELDGAVDAHHDIVRFRWLLRAPNGETPVAGFDVAELDQGLIHRVHGFLDKVPQAV